MRSLIKKKQNKTKQKNSVLRTSLVILYHFILLLIWKFKRFDLVVMTEPLQLRGVDDIINPSYCVEVNLDSSVQGEGSLSVTSNQTRAVRSFDFEIARMLSDQIWLHSVQLPLSIRNNMKITILDERPLVFGILVDQITTYATPQGLQLFCTKNCLPSTKCKEYCLRNSRRYHVSICKMNRFKNSFFSQKLYVDAFT